jgi:phosphoribosylaminoimidazole-succinocarboxamide synthase
MQPLIRSEVPGWPCRRGKVRDVYDLGDRLVLVATDRLSAFDWVLPTPIPDKGRALTALSRFWFEWLGEPNHLIAGEPLPAGFAGLGERSTLVRKTRVIPFECVVRGYLAGSGWKEYQAGGAVCGVPLPAGLRQSEKLPEPIFTPATKAEQGHDENVSFDVMADAVGRDTACELRDRSLAVYRRAAAFAADRGVILADTKLEWGRLPDGSIILIDEILTPDSSRYWPAESFGVGGSPPSFDKQYVRDWLEASGWDKASPPPALPAEVAERTAAKYREAYERLVGRPLDG